MTIAMESFVDIKPEMECSFSSWCVCRVVLHKLAADVLSNDDVLTDPACGSIPTCRDNPRIKSNRQTHRSFQPPAPGAATGLTATKSGPLPKASPSNVARGEGREFYEEATRGRSASHHLQVKAALSLSIRCLDRRRIGLCLLMRSRPVAPIAKITTGTPSARPASPRVP